MSIAQVAHDLYRGIKVIKNRVKDLEMLTPEDILDLKTILTLCECMSSGIEDSLEKHKSIPKKS